MKGANRGQHHHLRLGAAGTLVFLLLLSGTWKIDATYSGSVAEAVHPMADEFLNGGGAPSDGSSSRRRAEGGASDDDGQGGLSSSSLRRLLLLNSPTDRLGFCNESTVAPLTAVHFQIIENGLREYRCWTPRLGRLMTMLRQELNRAGGNSGGWSPGGDRRQQSANEGSRLRCRILFKYDTCRSNFAKYRSMDSPEISTEWPEEILNIINSTL